MPFELWHVDPGAHSYREGDADAGACAGEAPSRDACRAFVSRRRCRSVPTELKLRHARGDGSRSETTHAFNTRTKRTVS
jgi:hypothetical protein